MTTTNDDDLLRRLYQNLEENPQWLNKFIQLFNPDFVRRDELTQVLEELKKQREDMNKRFEAVDKRFEESNKRYEELREDMNKRFEAVDKRFEAVDKRFEQLIAEMNKRFEAVDKRFEAVDKRFEQLIAEMNKRFEAVDKRFEQLIAEMNKRFEAVDKRFEAMDRRFEKVFARLDDMSRSFGHDFEEFNSYWLETFLIELGYPRVKIEKKVFIDDNYEVFPDSKEVEIDLFNADPLVIGEVKAVTRTIDKINLFLRKVAFLEKKLGPAKYKLYITYGIEPAIRDEGINLLTDAGIDIILVSRHKVIKASNKQE